MSVADEAERVVVVTKSRLHSWWLRAVRGYRLTGRTQSPKKAPFGEVRLVDTWWLERKR